MAMQRTALIVDDDRSERRLITSVLRSSLDLNFLEAEHGQDALRILNSNKNSAIALIVLDLEMPVMGGIEALKIIKKNHSRIPVIVLTGSTDTKDAVDAMKAGAVDFLSKPIERARLDVSARNALKMSVMAQEIQHLRRRTGDALNFSDLIGFESTLSPIIQTGRKAAACDLPVLISGETGTGKEMLARAIHGESSRGDQSFITVNCGAIPEKLVESTLFGHEKGAFTGAVLKATGKFQDANGGSIFLDEIGELPLEAQVKLLRVLQQQEVEPVGASKPILINVRIISATNRNLADEVREGRFREDLFFRLNVLPVELPPLRRRVEDIPAMTQFFIRQFCALHKAAPKNITPETMQKLQSHSWPGNVRELENVINRAMALNDGERLGPGDLSFISTSPVQEFQTKGGVIFPMRADGSFKSFQELEQEIVALALAHHDHNISRTARVLGIAKSTLYAKIGTLADLKSA